MSVQELPVKSFGGLNLRDAADKVADNEFTQLSNVYQASKGVFFNRFGTSAAYAYSFPLVSRVSGIQRHYNANGDRITLLHCAPNSTALPDNTSDLVLTVVADHLGNLFAAGALETLRFCYSWIGAGLEQTYNSRNRASFPSAGSFPLDAWSNPAHQSTTVASGDDSIDVTVPAFPAGVFGANIFMARGVHSQMVYVGTVTTSGGTLKVTEYIAPQAAFQDAIVPLGVNAVSANGGTLTPGVYYVGLAWVVDTNIQEGARADGSGNIGYTEVGYTTTVNVAAGCNAITINPQVAASGNGAHAMYAFISTTPIQRASANFVGMVRINVAKTFLSLTHTNASTVPGYYPATVPIFCNRVNDAELGGAVYGNGGQPFSGAPTVAGKVSARFGFLLGQKEPSGTIFEIFPSRSMAILRQQAFITKVYGGDSGVGNDIVSWLHNYVSQPRTPNDKYNATQPMAWGYTPIDPNFTYLLGVTYFANGVDILWQTDGYSLSQLVPAVDATPVTTLLPPIAKFVFSYNNGLVVAGAQAGNQMYGSNAGTPNNWSTGGVGTALRFVTVGDALGPGISSSGTFSPQTEATSNPNSYIIGFKKNGSWMIATIPDPTGSTISGNLFGTQQPSPMIQISGRVGCVAYRSVSNTPLGTVFLGQDANVYLINAVAEPRRIGTKIQNLLLHLVGNDAAMQNCTAVFHDKHYKLSYPSAANVAAGNTYCDAEVWADLRVEEGDRITWVGPMSGIHVGAQTVLTGSGDNMQRLIADNYTGSLVRPAITDNIALLTDFGAPIVPVIQSKIYRFGAAAHLKRMLGAFLDVYLDYGYTNSLLLEMFADSYYGRVNKSISSAGAVWDASQWDQSNYADAAWVGVSMLLDGTNLVGRTVQWKLTYVGTGPFALAESTLLTQIERRRIAT